MEKIAASFAQIAAEALLKTGAETKPPVSLTAPVMTGLMAWIAAQPEPQPTPQQAIERAVAEWLASQGFPTNHP